MHFNLRIDELALARFRRMQNCVGSLLEYCVIESCHDLVVSEQIFVAIKCGFNPYKSYLEVGLPGRGNRHRRDISL